MNSNPINFIDPLGLAPIDPGATRLDLADFGEYDFHSALGDLFGLTGGVGLPADSRQPGTVYVTGHDLLAGQGHLAIEYQRSAEISPETISAGPSSYTGIGERLVGGLDRESDQPALNYTVASVVPPTGMLSVHYWRVLTGALGAYSADQSTIHEAVTFSSSAATLMTDTQYYLRVDTTASDKVYIHYDQESSYSPGSLVNKDGVSEGSSKDLLFAIEGSYPVPVPEPSTALLVSLGLASWAHARRVGRSRGRSFPSA